ncbi:MAG TPA: NAD(P)H-quinone oxidoreductase [Steroidobacteraceae bacterium]|nr:NAD(P)H-quinone oxidoreductase [Steroidobacteraceae bacterium]
MSQMHAVTFKSPGPPEVLTWSTFASPVPTPDDVVIDIHAAGINNADLLQRHGVYPVPPGASPILGLECSGTISWVGGNARGWKVGDRVCALLTGGGYAEQVAVPWEQVLPLPRGVDVLQAAGLPEAACTVFSNLSMKAQLQPGMSLLVHGGGSGIGTFAIQWAKAIGVTVVTTAGSEEKLNRCAALGADILINYRDADFSEQTLLATDGKGVDRILDIVGADYLERNLKCLAVDGHLVIIGSSGSPVDPPLPLRLLMSKRQSVSATMLRARPREQKAAIVKAVLESVWPLIEAGKIVPVIDSVLPMAKAGDGHRLLAEGRTVGKILLTNGP